MPSKSIFLIIATLVLFVMCTNGQALYKPTMEDVQKSGVSIDTLVLGRRLYVNRCGSCHSLFLPSKFTKTEWTKVMPNMQKKAKCTDQESAMITKYLIARSKEE